MLGSALMRGLRVFLAGAVVAAAAAKTPPDGDVDENPRTADDRPDLSGTYDIATLTPLVRPARHGDSLFLTQEQAREIEEGERAVIVTGALASNPDRDASSPKGSAVVGTAGSPPGLRGARDIGVLLDARLKDHHVFNRFWFERGSGASVVDGRYRTSIITVPSDGSLPAMTPEGQQRLAALLASGIDTPALDLEGPGPYDDAELRPLAERCLLGINSVGGPPMLPVLYNNLKKIVQTPDYVVILVEMIHDARVIRMNAEHEPPEIRKWLGDSVGHWDGDTLVVDTTNFTRNPGLLAASESLHVVERFSRSDERTLLYQFTVDDPATWTAPWSGEYPWPATADRIYEYACHEGNHTLGSILRGARLLEAEAASDGAAKRKSGE